MGLISLIGKHYKDMEALIILLDRGKMSDYSDTSDFGAALFLAVVTIVGFILYAIVVRWREKHK